MIITVVAALDERRAIGRGNAMPWRLPDDFRRFRELTMGKPIAMGRRTAESIGRALPGRRNLVITRSGVAPYPGQEPVASLPHAIEAATDAAELIVGGGAEIYAQALPLAHRAHLTWVHVVIPDADAFFPEFPTRGWSEVTRQEHAADDRHPHAFTFADYVRDQA